MTVWKTIDSAPKDRDILIYREGRFYVARWRNVYETWGVSVERVPGEETPFHDVGTIGFLSAVAAHGPTHWTELPPPPDNTDV